MVLESEEVSQNKMGITNFKTLFSSKEIEWETPKNTFEELNKEFNFTLDPCCTKDNAKCSKFYTKEDNGLSKSWDNEKVFMNPPYGRQINDWIKKASETKGIVVCLIPARTDTKWFHDYCYKKASEIRFIRGRLKFGGNQNGSGSAPFPSMIVIFRNDLISTKNEKSIHEQVYGKDGTCGTLACDCHGNFPDSTKNEIKEEDKK